MVRATFTSRDAALASAWAFVLGGFARVSAQTPSTSGVITAVTANSSVTRPDVSLAGRLFVHGPTGNVAVGDYTSYNDTAAPTSRFEVDGDSLLRGSVRFDNSNGESALTVQDQNPTALTIEDQASPSPVTYAVVNSQTSRLELHAPLHVLDTRIEAKDDEAVGLRITAEAGNDLLVFDTTDDLENVAAKVPINADDATDACGTEEDSGACADLASVRIAGGLVVGKRTFMTGSVRVANATDATITDASTSDVDASVRLAGGLAVEKSAFVKAKAKILSDEDGDASGAGALYVAGGASVHGATFIGKDSGHSLTIDAENVTAVADNVAVEATSDGGVVRVRAKESVLFVAESNSGAGAGGVVITAGAAQNGFVKIRQDATSGSAPSDRLAIDASGGIAITTASNRAVAFASEGAVPRMTSLNGARASVGRVASLTDDLATTATVATVRLAPGGSASVTLDLSCDWTQGGDGSNPPASFRAELFIAHHGGAAPEPSDQTVPRRTGVTRARAEFPAGKTDSGFAVATVPDDSGGAGATKDFAIKVATEDGGSGDAPSACDAEVVAEARGKFESLG